MCLSICCTPIRPSVFLYPFDKSNCQWSFTKPGLFIDIMEIRFGIANVANFMISDRVICTRHDNGGLLSFDVYKRDNFFDFLFVFFHTKTILKGSALTGEQILPFQNRSFQSWGLNDFENYFFWRPRWLSWMRRPTGARRLWVQPPLRSATFFRGDWSWNIFYGHSFPSIDSRRAVVSFWQKNVHNTG